MIFLDILVMEIIIQVLKRRISNVYDFTKLLSFKDKIKFFYNNEADFNTLSLFHTKDYLEVLKETERLQKISLVNSKKYNLATTSNPIFKEMYKRHAIATGALVLAGELLENNYNYIFCQDQELITEGQIWHLVFVT